MPPIDLKIKPTSWLEQADALVALVGDRRKKKAARERGKL